MKDLNIDFINKNQYFIGLSMIMLSIGGRYIISELNDEYQEKISSYYFRKIIIFCAFFMATRDILKAIILTIIFISIIMLTKSNEGKENGDEDEDEHEGYFLPSDGIIYL